MTSSRRNKLAAAAVFLMISAVVVGGMTWATVTSFQLAREHVTKDHERKIREAVWQLDSSIAAILYAENRRESDEYRAFQFREPIITLSRGRVERDADLAVLPSALRVKGPPHEWIDVYFQVEQNGDITSPLILEDESIWTVESDYVFAPWKSRARRALEWLSSTLPDIDLHERVAHVCQNQLNSLDDEAREAAPEQAKPRPDGRTTTASSQFGRDYKQRKKSLGDSQARYVPPMECVDPDIARARNPRELPGQASEGEEGASRSALQVEMTPEPINAFWLEPGSDGILKLAFVRPVHQGNNVVYQGFVGDWGRLRPELLGTIENISLPGVDLQPVLADSPANLDTGAKQMTNLPVRLAVADVPGGAVAAAWGQVGGKLVTTWFAAAAVLVVAGWGLHNLVKLTDRRMQFAYAVTHELRTPLTTFRLYSDMLSAGLVPDGSKQTYLDTLHRESIRLSSLVEGVLEYARLENQKVKLNLRDTDGESLLHPIRETLDRRCLENGIKPETQIALTNGQKLRTDVDVVHRIAGVLVNNACRHARGPGDAKVLVRLGSDNGQVYLDVIDTGPGVDRRDTRAIFRPFRRGRKADAAAQGGIGLGLALARNWARLLGGDVELAARHHPQFGGAHFRLTFPARIDPS